MSMLIRRRAARQLASYIDFYNFERPHQSLDYQTPAQLYACDKLPGTARQGRCNISPPLNSPLFQL